VAVAGTTQSIGNLSVNNVKFTVAAATGSTAIGGTMKTSGDLTVGNNQFRVMAANGNIMTYHLKEDFEPSDQGMVLVTTMEERFIVRASDGNIHTPGSAVFDTLSTTSNLSVNDNQLTIIAANGNVAVAGSMKAIGDLTVGDNKFQVVAANGDIVTFQKKKKSGW
jgi:hypothetical protein